MCSGATAVTSVQAQDELRRCITTQPHTPFSDPLAEARIQ